MDHVKRACDRTRGITILHELQFVAFETSDLFAWLTRNDIVNVCFASSTKWRYRLNAFELLQIGACAIFEAGCDFQYNAQTPVVRCRNGSENLKRTWLTHLPTKPASCQVSGCHAHASPSNCIRIRMLKLCK